MACRFTAEDVAFTFQLVLDNQDSMVHTAEIHLLDSVEVIDDNKVRFQLKDPSPSWWVNTLTSNHGLSEQIVPKHIWEDKDPLTFTFYDPDQGWPVSTGPFALASAAAEQKVFVRRSDWWALEAGFKDLPAMEKVVYIPQREESARAQMIIQNEIDAMSMAPVATLLNIFEQNPDVVSWSKQEPPYGYLDWCPIGLFVNNAADSPVAQSKDIRWALNYALNREVLVDNAERGAGTVAFHMITPYSWFDPFEEVLQPIYEKHTVDTTDHYDLMEGRDDGCRIREERRRLVGKGRRNALHEHQLPDMAGSVWRPRCQAVAGRWFRSRDGSQPRRRSRIRARRARLLLWMQRTVRRSRRRPVLHALAILVRYVPRHRRTSGQSVGDRALAQRGV